MRLLYTLTTYPPSIGGAQLHQHLIAQQLKQQHQIQVITHWDQNRTDWLLGTTINAPQHTYSYSIDDIPVCRIGLTLKDKISLLPSVLLYYPCMDLALPAIANCFGKYLENYAQQADLIHNVRIGREGMTYASYQLARKYQIPWILTAVHHPRWVGWRYRAYIKLYQQADAVIALTQVEKQILMSLGVKPELITVTGMGPILAETANVPAFQEKYKISDPIILFLGQHYAYKGYQQLLQAAPLVWKKFPEAQFVFAGPSVGDSEQYFKNQDPRIHRLGALSLQDKTSALAACTMVCVPSSQESFGGVYTEAWYFHKPVIGCNIPAVAEVIDHGINGYLVSQNSEEIADAICQLLLHSDLAATMGKAGNQKLQEKYTWSRIARLTEALYAKIIH